MTTAAFQTGLLKQAFKMKPEKNAPGNDQFVIGEVFGSLLCATKGPPHGA